MKRHAQRLRQGARGGDADPQAGERPRPDTDRDRGHVVPGGPARSSSRASAGSSSAEWRAARAAAPGRAAACGRARRRRDHARGRDGHRGVEADQGHVRKGSPHGLHEPLLAAGLDPAPVAAQVREPQARAPRARGSSSAAPAPGHSTNVTPLGRQVVRQQRRVLAARGPRAGTGRRATTGTRPAYTCPIVNEGLVTGSVTPRRSHAARTNVVLPVPTSPAISTTSPGRSIAPTARAPRARCRSCRLRVAVARPPRLMGEAIRSSDIQLERRDGPRTLSSSSGVRTGRAGPPRRRRRPASGSGSRLAGSGPAPGDRRGRLSPGSGCASSSGSALKSSRSRSSIAGRVERGGRMEDRVQEHRAAAELAHLRDAAHLA